VWGYVRAEAQSRDTRRPKPCQKKTSFFLDLVFEATKDRKSSRVEPACGMFTFAIAVESQTLAGYIAAHPRACILSVPFALADSSVFSRPATLASRPAFHAIRRAAEPTTSLHALQQLFLAPFPATFASIADVVCPRVLCPCLLRLLPSPRDLECQSYI